MFNIDCDQNIFLTKGDSAALSLTLNSPDFPYEEYTLTPQDVALLTVRQSAKITNTVPAIILQKTYANGCFTITPQDTQNCDYGGYCYDIQITFMDGSVNTVIPFKNCKLPKFVICEEVT